MKCPTNKRQVETQIRQLQDCLVQIEEVESGDRPSPAQQKLMKSQKFSYQATFVRRKALRKVKQKGEIRTSSRRFSSLKEATQHAKRFSKIHRHRSYKVARVNKRANAWVNWRTGKTNPELC